MIGWFIRLFKSDEIYKIVRKGKKTKCVPYPEPTYS